MGRSTDPPAKPTGLLTGRSHDSVVLFWDNPGDDTITGYQVLRGDTAENLATLTSDTGDTSASYTDDSVTASATYAYAVRARNANGLSPHSDPVSVTTLAPLPGEDLTTALSTDQSGTLTLTPGAARDLRFERHEDIDQFTFAHTAGTTYRLSVHLIWPGSAASSVSITGLGSVLEAFVLARSPVTLPGGVEFVFTPTIKDAQSSQISINIKGIHWTADSDGKYQCGSDSVDESIIHYCYWSSDYTIMEEEVASAAESTSSSTDVCPSYESYPDSFRIACAMDIDDDVMGYINSQGDRDLWALVQFEADSGYTVKMHGDVDPNNLLDNAQITLRDQWGIPKARGSASASDSPASLSIAQSKTYTGLYYLEVRSSDAAGAYRIEVTD